MMNDDISRKRLSWRVRLSNHLQRFYVVVMINVIARLLAACSCVDKVFRDEIAQLPEGFVLSMGVLPKGPAIYLRKHKSGSLQCVQLKQFAEVDLTISFKHITHAFLVFSFQEGTAASFANERMLLNGEISEGMIVVRCLNRMESLVLPRFIASKILKRYPTIRLQEKMLGALRIYCAFLAGFFRSNSHVE